MSLLNIRKSLFKLAVITTVSGGLSIISSPAFAIHSSPTNYSVDKHQKLALTYDIYAGGFKALNASLQMELNKKDYDMTLEAKTQGFIGNVFPWKTSINTSGHTTDGELVPSTHKESSTWKTNTKVTEVNYGSDGKILETTVKQDGQEHTKKNTNDVISNNAVDVLTGTLNMLQNAKNTNKCEGSFPVFDGKRRFNIKLSDAGTDTLEKSKYSQFTGEALRCTLKVEPVAGFGKKDAERGWMAVQSHTEKRKKLPTIWLGKLKGSNQMVPVRMEIASSYGSVVAHLSKKAIN